MNVLYHLRLTKLYFAIILNGQISGFSIRTLEHTISQVVSNCGKKIMLASIMLTHNNSILPQSNELVQGCNVPEIDFNILSPVCTVNQCGCTDHCTTFSGFVPIFLPILVICQFLASACSSFPRLILPHVPMLQYHWANKCSQMPSTFQNALYQLVSF